MIAINTLLLLFTIFTATITKINGRSIDEYQQNRTRILEQEAIYSLGGNLRLSEEEILVNNILTKLKDDEVAKAFYKPENFNFSKPYFTYKEYIETSKVYQIIKKMPKGAALHVHSTFVLDADYLLNATYEDHLYACQKGNDLLLHFADDIPTRPCGSQWTLLSELRSASDNVIQFDEELKQKFTLYSKDDPIEGDIDKAWAKFNNIHLITKSLLTYRPVRERYIYETLKKFYDDNIMYIEMRSGLHILYELNGTEHDAAYIIKLHRDVTTRFMKDYPDFVGIKFILTTHRSAGVEKIKKAINLVIDIKKEFPSMVAGFDLVGQEDKGKPLTEFLPQLLEAKDSLDFYFHAGETNWSGTASDENLIDAILLGTKRIGHGFALAKHPVLMSMVLRQDIAVEVNVVSNAALALVGDVRAHPLATFLALGLPVLLSSDDPGVWGAAPLSHDFYIAFVAVASRRADLRLLKQLAFNSIRYSSLENKRKVRLFKVFNRRWRTFLREVIAEYRS